MNLFRKTTRVLIAAIAVAALALISAPAAPTAQAGGLRNCVDVIGSPVGCYELVWVDGVQLRMTFANQQFKGATPGDKIGNFYVMAAQTDTPQGTLPFPHDHVVDDVPVQNHGNYSVLLHGYFVLCSAEGMASGACVPEIASTPWGTLPLARTVEGQMLTSAEAMESAASAGLVTLVDTGGYLVATLGPAK